MPNTNTAMLSKPQFSAPYRALYAYAWDVLDTGVTRFVEQVLAMGITDVTLATSYHAGKFLRPHAQHSPRVIFPEDGVVYFDADLSQYGTIKPKLHSDAAIRSVLPALLADGRLKIHGWTVLLHNSRIGQEQPQYCAQNVFGDPYLYSLCPMQEEVFEYAVKLCADLSHQHGLSSLVLETPGWLPYGHGYHHEFAQVRSEAWLDTMLGLCFCPACKQRARSNGIEVDHLQERIATQVHDYLQTPLQISPDQSSAWLQADLLSDADLAAFLHMRQQRVTELVTAIRMTMPKTVQLAVIPTVQRPTAQCWTEGSDLFALAQAADYLEIPFYEATAQRVLADAWDSLRRVEDKHKIRAILRPGVPDLADGAGLQAAIQALQSLGIEHLAFYNYGMLPEYQLQHLAKTLQGIEHAE